MGNKQYINPLVSIIVVTYNSSKFVLDTLESAKNQSYKNIELIVTDDCSPDNTVEICRNWIEVNKQRFVNIELITVAKNTGIAANCNRGIGKAKGKWLKFIAGDDILLENCIEDNVLFVNSNPDAKFVSSNIRSFGTKGNIIENIITLYDGFKKHYLKKSAKEQLKLYARLPVFLNSPTFFINKETVISIDCFDEQFRIYDDMCLIYRFNSNNIRMYYLDMLTVKYRIHEDAVSRTKNGSIEELRNKEQILIFLKYRKQHLNKLNLIDLSVYYEIWLNYKFKGFLGHKATNILNKFSLLHWYLKYLNFKL
jgi:alpha-1,3-rhamnosyltransferase